MDDKDPLTRFQSSFLRASEGAAFDATACVLATADRRGQPTARYVLFKQVDAEGLVFFTNRRSRKGRDLEENPRASVCVYWPWTGEQYRLEGEVLPIADCDSDEYFATRPRDSQLGAWASQQSAALPSRQALEAEVEAVRQRFEGRPIPRPQWWGGYRLVPHTVEHWCERPFRLHERHLYERRGNDWRVSLLYP